MAHNNSHQKTVLKAGSIAIVVNIMLAFFKILVGAVSNSLAVTSDAIHGLVDTLSGIIVIVSEKLGSSHKFSRNHEKIEHIGAVIIAIIILIVGIHIFIESIKGIVTPSSENTDYSAPIIIVLIASIIAKLLLGRYLRTTGRQVKSDTLLASSIETINDSIISGAVLLSAIIHAIWHINIEPYISIVIAVVILKLGLGLIFPQISSHHH